MQNNPKKEKTLFSRLTKTLDGIERPYKGQTIIIANQIPETAFTNIGQKLGSYSKYLKQVRHNKPVKLQVAAG